MTRSHAVPRSARLHRRHSFLPRAEGLEVRLLLSAGDLDTSFGTGGFVRASSGSNLSDVAKAVELQTDGKILVAGQGSGFQVIRLTGSGAMDTSFGSGGRALPSPGDAAYDMALQIDPVTG